MFIKQNKKLTKKQLSRYKKNPPNIKKHRFYVENELYIHVFCLFNFDKPPPTTTVVYFFTFI